MTFWEVEGRALKSLQQDTCPYDGRYAHCMYSVYCILWEWIWSSHWNQVLQIAILLLASISFHTIVQIPLCEEKKSIWPLFSLIINIWLCYNNMWLCLCIYSIIHLLGCSNYCWALWFIFPVLQTNEHTY